MIQLRVGEAFVWSHSGILHLLPALGWGFSHCGMALSEQEIDGDRLSRSVRITLDGPLEGDVHVTLFRLLTEKFEYDKSEIACIGQLRGSKDWYVLFRSQSAAKEFSQVPYPCQISGSDVCFSTGPLLRKFVTVRIHWLQVVSEDRVVDSFIHRFGEIDKSWMEVHRVTGVQVYRLKANLEVLDVIPYTTSIAGFQSLLIVSGRPLCV